MRMPGRDKGDAVRTILAGHITHTPRQGLSTLRVGLALLLGLLADFGPVLFPNIGIDFHD
jgi:hypothetical protein